MYVGSLDIFSVHFCTSWSRNRSYSNRCSYWSWSRSRSYSNGCSHWSWSRSSLCRTRLQGSCCKLLTKLGVQLEVTLDLLWQSGWLRSSLGLRNPLELRSNLRLRSSLGLRCSLLLGIKYEGWLQLLLSRHGCCCCWKPHLTTCWTLRLGLSIDCGEI